MRSPTPDLLPGLLAQIREAWTDRRDTALVHRLAARYEEHADTLYDFLDHLVDLDLDRRSPDTRDRVAFAEAVRDWRDDRFPSPGTDDCGGAPPDGPTPSDVRPQPVLKLVKGRTGLRGPDIERDTRMRPAFISKTNQHAADLPAAWGREISGRLHRAYPGEVGEDEAFVSWRHGYRTDRQAASRSGAVDHSAPTPEELLDMCRVTDPEERALWLRLADDTDKTDAP